MTERGPLPPDASPEEGTFLTRAICAPYLALALDLDRALERLRTYRDLLEARNRQMNLTAVRDREGIERRLFIESLRLLPPLDEIAPFAADQSAPRRSLVDVGSGGGIPGIVLAICRPDLDVTLVDATGKKVEFLRDAIEHLGLAATAATKSRAEDLGRDPAWRGRFDIATARAVAALPALLEFCLPLLRPGGHALLPKGVAIDDELAMGEIAAGLLGGRILGASILPDGASSVATRLVLVRKDVPTPETYPRRTGLPVQSPLGSRGGLRSRT